MPTFDITSEFNTQEITNAVMMDLKYLKKI